MAIERTSGGSTSLVGRALRSPTAIVLAAAGAGIGALAGFPAAAVAGIAAAGYGVGAAVAGLLRGGGRRRSERIDPFTLGEPWRLRVREAMSARSRYEKAIEGTRPGPLRDRLAEIGVRMEAGVQECWRIANQANELGRGLSALEPGRIRRDLAAAESVAGEDVEGDPRVAALRAQAGSAERMAATASDADARLKLLSARLDEAAARAIEVSLGAASDADLSGLGSEVDEVVLQLEALRLALGEVEG